MKRIHKLFFSTLSIFLLAPALSQAVTFTVNDMADTVDAAPGDGLCADAGRNCTLRAAIGEANALAGSDEIYFDVSGTITLSGSSLPTIRESLTLWGPGAEQLTIDANGGRRIFLVNSHGTSQAFKVLGLTLANGQGGVSVSESTDSLTVHASVIRDHRTDDASGAGIDFRGNNLSVSDSLIINNHATGASGYGGGIFLYSMGTTRINNSTIHFNSAAEDGGGIRHAQLGNVHLNNVTLSANQSDRHGGGLSNGFTAVVNLSNVTVTGNISDRDANGSGAGGGLHRANGVINIKNSIIAGNYDNSATAPDCEGTITSLDYNLIQDTTGCILTGTTTHNITSEDPLLEALARNGGATPTHALQSGSPALDAGDPAGCTIGSGSPLLEDQRGFDRPIGDACDIGAFESGDCGDGFVDFNEACDDGNLADSDGCDSLCQTEVVAPPVEEPVEEPAEEPTNDDDEDVPPAELENDEATESSMPASSGCSLQSRESANPMAYLAWALFISLFAIRRFRS